MQKKSVFTKSLAVAGTLLAAFPIFAPILLAIAAIFIRRRFLFDYLMPAELFPAALLGGALLIWAAVRVRSGRALIGGGLGAAVAFLVLSQVLAVVTGLASGAVEPVGWPWVLVHATIILYSLALVVLAVGGVLLLRDLFKSPQLSA